MKQGSAIMINADVKENATGDPNGAGLPKPAQMDFCAREIVEWIG